MSAVSAEEREDSSSLLAGRRAIVGIDSVFTVGSALKAKLRSALALSEEFRVERRVGGDNAWKTLEVSLEAREVRMMGKLRSQKTGRVSHVECGSKAMGQFGFPSLGDDPSSPTSDFQLSEGCNFFSPIHTPHSA